MKQSFGFTMMFMISFLFVQQFRPTTIDPVQYIDFENLFLNQ